MDRVTFFNQALGVLGDDEYVSGTPAYDACNLWWPEVAREMLASGSWTWATREVTLEAGETGEYRLPTDCIKLLHVGARRYVLLGRTLRVRGGATDGGLTVRYVSDGWARAEVMPDVSPKFIHAVRMLLAARMAPKLTGDVRLAQALEAQAWQAQEDALHEDARQWSSNDQHPLEDIINNSITTH